MSISDPYLKEMWPAQSFTFENYKLSHCPLKWSCWQPRTWNSSFFSKGATVAVLTVGMGPQRAQTKS